MRPVRVYRLVITYPEGSQVLGWRPACWSDPEFLRTLSRKARRELRGTVFCWPTERQFLSSSGAQGRASLLRWYGAGVEVYASDPVTWPDQDQVDSLNGRDWDSPDKAMRWTPGHSALADAWDAYVTEKTVEALREREPVA